VVSGSFVGWCRTGVKGDWIVGCGVVVRMRGILVATVTTTEVDRDSKRAGDKYFNLNKGKLRAPRLSLSEVGRRGKGSQGW